MGQIFKQLILILVLVIVAWGLYVFARGFAARDKDGDLVACTTDAKICPDGSAVGRTGPACEFAPCPGE